MVVGMLPIGNADARDPDAYPGGETKSYRVGEVFRDLVSIATEHVRVKCVYADREFAAVDTIAALEEHDLFYMIPAPRNDRTKRWLERNVDVEQGILAVEQEWGVYGPVKHGASNERVETTLIGLPGDPDEEQYGFGESDDDDDDDDESLGAVPFYTKSRLTMRLRSIVARPSGRSNGTTAGVGLRRLTRRSRSSRRTRHRRSSVFDCLNSGSLSCCTTCGCSLISSCRSA